jgi:hypothetical protein
MSILCDTHSCYPVAWCSVGYHGLTCRKIVSVADGGRWNESRINVRAELWFTRRLSADERDLWNLVRPELSWTEIAERMGGVSSPEAVRKTFARAVRRIAGELKTLVRAHE